MEWWRSQPEAWAACRETPPPPAAVMPRYVEWLKALPGRPVFAGYPAAFDFTFVYWYLIRGAGTAADRGGNNLSTTKRSIRACTVDDGCLAMASLRAFDKFGKTTKSRCTRDNNMRPHLFQTTVGQQTINHCLYSISHFIARSRKAENSDDFQADTFSLYPE